MKEFREDSNNIQFNGSRQMHRKRTLHRIELQEHRGEYGFEDHRERTSLLKLHRKGNRVDVEALHDRIPLQQGAGKGA